MTSHALPSSAARGSSSRRRCPITSRLGLVVCFGFSGGPSVACGVDEGTVEIHWSFVDANLQRISPGAGGNEQGTCALQDWLRPRGSGEAIFDELDDVVLRVRLLGYECADTANPGTGATSPCPAEAPVVDERFECDESGAVVTQIPAQTDAMVWITQIEVDDGTGAAFVARADCISVPGPRQRKILPGRITDLELYEFVVHGTRDSPLLLSQCQ